MADGVDGGFLAGFSPNLIGMYFLWCLVLITDVDAKMHFTGVRKFRVSHNSVFLLFRAKSTNVAK